jgi:putative SbcD/Mre11-related phosphoesterase
MESIEIHPGVHITNHFCAYLEQKKTIVLADLHLGYEAALHEDGVTVPKVQKDEMLQRLDTIFKEYPCERVVIAGDFKHQFSKNLWQEWEEVMEVLEFIHDTAEVSVIRGNHDNYLATILSKRGMELVDSHETGGCLITHGHKDFELRPDVLTIIAHEHPSVRIRDEIGASVKTPCYVHHEEKRLLVLPAFSPLAGGSDLTIRDKFFSPVLKRVDMMQARIFSISEIGLLDFGCLKNLMPQPDHSDAF